MVLHLIRYEIQKPTDNNYYYVNLHYKITNYQNISFYIISQTLNTDFESFDSLPGLFADKYDVHVYKIRAL